METQSYNVTLELLLDFIGAHFWKIVIVVFLISFRKGIGRFIDRIIKLSFSVGDASGAVEAVAPGEPISEPPKADSGSESDIDDDEDGSRAESEGATEENGNWISRMEAAFRDGDNERARNVFEEHQRTEADADSRYANEAFYLHFLFTLGNDRSAINKLEQLVARSETDKQLLSSTVWFASTLSDVNDYTRAAKAWLDAIEKVQSDERKTTFVTSLAYTYKNDSKISDGIALLESRLQEIEDQQKPKIYTAMSNLEKAAGNDEAAAIALEKAVELSLGDRDKLFDAAYAESNEDLRLLSVINYQTLLGLDPDHGTALNNLGVCAGELGLNGRKVSLYKQAADKGSTLAMANIANELIANGNWIEAKEVLDAARKDDDPHKNVGNALFRLENAEEDEKKKWREIVKKARDFQKRVRAYGSAMFEESPEPGDFTGTWYSPSGDSLEVESEDDRIKAEWLEVRRGLGSSSSYKCRIFGIPRNRAATVTYFQDLVGERIGGLLSSASNKAVKCFSYLSADRQTWEIFSRQSEEEFSIALKRRTPD